MNRRAFFARLTAALAALLAPLKLWGEEPPIEGPELNEATEHMRGIWLKMDDGSWQRMMYVGGNDFAVWGGGTFDGETIRWRETP